MNASELKQAVKAYWNKASCGTETTSQQKFSKAYFEEIEAYRYRIEPEIFSFAQFTRWHDKKILEVGVGAGSDFLQWVRTGTYAYGIDLTEEAVANVQQRLRVYGLKAVEVRVADAEQLPYADNSFDLVYSWGVIHHSPDMVQCLREIVRVTRPGGTIKVMIYNRRSLFALYRWILAALLKGRPFQSFAYVLFHDQESPGTQAYTTHEMEQIIVAMPVQLVSMQSRVTAHDLLFYKGVAARCVAYILACIWGWNTAGWFLTFELKKH